MATLISSDPATGETLGEVETADRERLDAEVAAAARAFASDWSRDTVARGRALSAWADAVEREAGPLGELIMRETGKVPRETAKELELTIDALRFNAGAARVLDGGAGTLSDGSVAHLVREPVGVCGFIAPWNWPVFLLVRDLAPGLAAGVTAVVKPAPQTPLATQEVLRLGRESGVPDGVLGLVFGDGDIGEALVEHPTVRAVSFTGSTQVGRSVMTSAAKDFTRVLLELGGKGSSVIYGDADLDTAVAACVQNAFISSGQMCMANSRILVERGVFEQVLDAICDRVRGLAAGPPDDPASTFGPLISSAHRDRVNGYLDLARDHVTVTGSAPEPDGRGAYLPPTVLAGDGIHERVLREEVFGPVVTVEPFAGEAEAVALATASPYGLSAAVWTADVGRAWRTAGRLRTGTVWINRYNRMFAEVPSGGMGDSGVGRTRGLEGIHEFTELKHVNWEVPPGA